MPSIFVQYLPPFHPLHLHLSHPAPSLPLLSLTQQIRVRVGVWDNKACIGDVFIPLLEQLKMYSVYVNNYHLALMELSKQQKYECTENHVDFKLCVCARARVCIIYFQIQLERAEFSLVNHSLSPTLPLPLLFTFSLSHTQREEEIR